MEREDIGDLENRRFWPQENAGKNLGPVDYFD